MLRQALRCAASAGRQLSTSRPLLAEAPMSAETKAFLDAFAERAPSTMAPPSFPTEFLTKAAAAVAGTPDKVTLNFYLPHSIEFQGQKVDQVSIPATTGEFGVLPGHVPTVAQLKPGVLAVHLEADKNVKKYFVSSGFAFVHADSTTDICAVEAVPLEQLDHEAVKQGLADYQAKLISAKDDYEKARCWDCLKAFPALAAAQIGIEVCSAMNAALS